MLFYRLHNCDLLRVMGPNVGQLPRFNVFEVRPARGENEPRMKKRKTIVKLQAGRDYKEKKELERQTGMI